ncbi:hypothetical protein [Alkalicoccobacillus porphyridii]|uniref:Major facilitator superfamily (MFS) profile domain-containing protein n=1 Tax=Alkalicoccobacillus porphyridii TaxID=2597270 RepID=A0A553ZU21_9BACI|nr:hypothetical protein [Alkalicoccobacillus porphyridii]TSB44968.1 hypothetical protein FN960_18510 [Alkalicoccobacillus porphyridii]
MSKRSKIALRVILATTFGQTLLFLIAALLTGNWKLLVWSSTFGVIVGIPVLLIVMRQIRLKKT